MFKSRSATPQQLEELRELAAETQSGIFGMPTSTQVLEKWDIHVYELVKIQIVERLKPTGFKFPAEVVEHLDYKPVLFRPSLEVALGQRAVNSAQYGEYLEPQTEAEEQERRIWDNVYGHDSGPVPKVADLFDSEYAKLRGGFLLNLSIDAVLPNTHPTNEYSIDYEIQTPRARLSPQQSDLDSRVSLQASKKTVGYGRKFDTHLRKTNRDKVKLRIRRRRISRFDVDAVKADLLVIKQEYADILNYSE